MFCFCSPTNNDVIDIMCDTLNVMEDPVKRLLKELWSSVYSEHQSLISSKANVCRECCYVSATFIEIQLMKRLLEVDKTEHFQSIQIMCHITDCGHGVSLTLNGFVSFPHVHAESDSS